MGYYDVIDDINTHAFVVFIKFSEVKYDYHISTSSGVRRKFSGGGHQVMISIGDVNERAPKGRCPSRGSGGMLPQKILLIFDLFCRLFLHSEALKFLIFNKFK